MDNFKDMKDSEQIQAEIEYWEGVVENGGKFIIGKTPICGEYYPNCSCGCPLYKFLGGPCDETPNFIDDDKSKTVEVVVIETLKEIKHKLFRLDR